MTVCSGGKSAKNLEIPNFVRNALDDYVWRDDGAFKWEIHSSKYDPARKLQTITVNFTSQTWLPDVEVSFFNSIFFD